MRTPSARAGPTIGATKEAAEAAEVVENDALVSHTEMAAQQARGTLPHRGSRKRAGAEECADYVRRRIARRGPSLVGASRATIFVMMVAWYVVIAVLLVCGAVRYLRRGSHTAIDTRSEERL